MAPADSIAVVEAAYRFVDARGAVVAQREHFDRLFDRIAPLLFDGLGGFAVLYDRAKPDLVTEVFSRGADPRIFQALYDAQQSDPDKLDLPFELMRPVDSLATITSVAPSEHPHYRALAKELGFRDILAIHCGSPDGTGCFVGVPRRALGVSTPIARTWTMVGAHVAAGLRLRRQLSAGARPEAVFSDRGKLLFAEGDAQGERALLGEACARMARSRGKLRRAFPDEALVGWEALVAGRWSLVEEIDTDGKRFVVAVTNECAAPDPRALSALEHQVLHHAARGFSDKLIAYTLGLSAGTVASVVLRLRRKLRASSRVALIEQYAALSSARWARVHAGRAVLHVGELPGRAPSPLAELSLAERQISEMAVSGMSNAAIARARRASPRTIANQLAGIYKKLAVGSRAELAALLRGTRA